MEMKGHKTFQKSIKVHKILHNIFNFLDDKIGRELLVLNEW